MTIVIQELNEMADWKEKRKKNNKQNLTTTKSIDLETITLSQISTMNLPTHAPQLENKNRSLLYNLPNLYRKNH